VFSQLGHKTNHLSSAGALAIVLCDVFPLAKVDAVDTSSQALEVAKINVNNHKLNDNVNLILSDMFHGVKDKKYDVIVSNPPYVTKSVRFSI
jgi:ribosomal protein L3 glutamine methyltransferase